MKRRHLLAGGAAHAAGVLAIGSAAPSAAGQPTRKPIVFSHRGAPGYRPEHTLNCYELAVRMGAEFMIESDLVPTKDGILVARHENDITGTTDVAERPEFAGRKTTKTIEGKANTGWFTEDFTLRELKTLRAIERTPDLRPENMLYNGLFEVPTLQEVLAFVRRMRRELGRPIRISLEPKHPTYFASIGLPLEAKVITDLKKAGLSRSKDTVNIGSFEPTSLKKLRTELDVTLTQQVWIGTPYDTVVNGKGPTFDDMVTPSGLRQISRYADWVGPDKERVIPVGPDGHLGKPTRLVADAHEAGLKVGPYTFRNENAYLPPALRIGTDPAAYGRAIDEYLAYYRAKVDGVWSDNPDTALVARRLI